MMNRMRCSKWLAIIFVGVLCFLVAGKPTISFAATDNTINHSVIELYDNGAGKNGTPQTGITNTGQATQAAQTQKAHGFLPQTSDMITIGYSFIGALIILLAVAAILFARRRRR